jgi:hypothetical protein
VVSLVVVVAGILEVETILVAEVEVISPRTRIVFHHASCVEEQITLLLSATRGLIQHTWGKKSQKTLPTPIWLTQIGMQILVQQIILQESLISLS